MSDHVNDLDRFTDLCKRLRHERDSLARCLANAACEGHHLDTWTRLYRKARHDEAFAYTLLSVALSPAAGESSKERHDEC